MLSKFVFRIASASIKRSSSFTSSAVAFGFARKAAQPSKKSALQMMSEDTTEEERRSLDELRIAQEKDKLLRSTKKRSERETDQQLQKQISKMIDQGLTNQQIVKKLAQSQGATTLQEDENNNNYEGFTQQKRSPAKREIFKTDDPVFNQVQDKLFGAMNINKNFNEQVLIAQQRMMIEELQKSAPASKKRLIVDKQKHKIEESMAKDLKYETKKETIIQAMVKNKSPEEYQQKLQERNSFFSMVPEELKEMARAYKNNEMKYMTNLVEPPKEHHRLRRGETLLKKQNKQQQEQVEEEIKERRGRKVSSTKQLIQKKFEENYKDVPVESTEEVKDRLLRQYEEITQAESNVSDVSFLREGAKDLQNVDDSLVFVNEQQRKQSKKLILKQSTYGVQEKRIKDFQKLMLVKQDMVFEIEDVKLMDKEMLLHDKQRLEELEQYNKYQQKKERLKEIKKLVGEIHEEELDEEPNYKEIYTSAIASPGGFVPKKKKDSLEKFAMIPDAAKIEEANIKYQRSIFKKENRQYEFHYQRTLDNMKNWLEGEIVTKPMTRKLDSSVFAQIQIEDIIPNNSLTVLNVLWHEKRPLDPRLLEEFEASLNRQLSDEEKKQKEEWIKQVNKKLEKEAGYLSSKMCQELGLRYGPDIRFKFYEESLELKNSKLQVTQELDAIIKERIKTDISKGILPPKMKKSDLDKLVSDYKEVMSRKLEDMNEKHQVLRKQNTSNEKKKKREKGEPRDNRTADGSRKKTPKANKNAAQRFWENL